MGMQASNQNVNFPYDACLALARALWSLSTAITGTYQPARASAAQTAVQEWQGRFRQDFDQRMSVSNTDATNVSGVLQQAARGLAAQWAEANFQQQQYNYARLVQQKKDSQSGWDKAGNYLFGDSTNYGSAPPPPTVPQPPGFEPTQVPQAHLP
jgi:hypothetical protein